MSSTLTSNLGLRKPSHRDPETLETWDYVLNNNFDIIDAAFGIRSYTEQNYVTNSDALTSSINKLDMALFDVATLAPTADQKAALVGPSGYAPTSLNPYATVNYVGGLITPARKIIIPAEYAGGVLWDAGGIIAGGSLTSDFEIVGAFGYNFYKWLSTIGETYYAVVRWKAPELFSAWSAVANTALIIDMLTEAAAATSTVGVTIYKDGVMGSPSAIGPFFGAGGLWYAERHSGGAQAPLLFYDATNPVLASIGAGDVLVIAIAMTSNNKFVKIGDITLQYTG